MKTTANIRKNLIAAVMMLSALSFTACSGSDSNDVVANTVEKEVVKAENSFSFKVMAVSKGQDITASGAVKNITLYVFDQNNDFVKEMALDKSVLLNRSTINVSCAGSSRITVIAWGGIEGQNTAVTPMNKANILSDLTVSLKQNNGIAAIPNDIFYGQITLTSNQTKSNDVSFLSIERKVASFDLSVAGITKKFGTTEGEFYVKVKQTNNSFNYKGELTGEGVEYIIPAYVTPTGMVAIDRTAVIPATDVVVELYRNDVKVFSVVKAKNGQNLSTIAGEQLFIRYDVSNASTAYVVGGFDEAIIFA